MSLKDTQYNIIKIPLNQTITNKYCKMKQVLNNCLLVSSNTRLNKFQCNFKLLKLG